MMTRGEGKADKTIHRVNRGVTSVVLFTRGIAGGPRKTRNSADAVYSCLINDPGIRLNNSPNKAAIK